MSSSSTRQAFEIPPQPQKKSKLNGFQKLALATTLATYFLIMVGGFVRAAGAGLGCPDWPRCFGYWWPPSSASQLPPQFDQSQFNPTLMWIEYINRMIGVAVGFLIMATLFVAVRRYRDVPRVLWSTVVAFVLVVFQGWLGAKVVELELKGWIVTVHLIVALVIVSLLLYATVCAFFPGGRPLANLPPERRWLAWMGIGVTGLSLVQLTLGALVRGHIDDVVKNNANLERGEWLAQVGLTDMLHRNGALVLTLAVLGLAAWTIREPRFRGWLHRTAWAMAALVLIQVAAGIGLAYAALPPPLQTIHIVVGTLLIGALTTLVLLAYRLPVPEDQPGAREPLLASEV